jgi:hypothetical protein
MSFTIVPKNKKLRKNKKVKEFLDMVSEKVSVEANKAWLDLMIYGTYVERRKPNMAAQKKVTKKAAKKMKTK